MVVCVGTLNLARQKAPCSPERYRASHQTDLTAVLLVKSSRKGEPLVDCVIYCVIYEAWERIGISEALLLLYLPSTSKANRPAKRYILLFVSEVKLRSLLILQHKQAVFVLRPFQGNGLFPHH